MLEANEGIIIKGANINIRYADDTVILTSNGKDLRITMNRLVISVCNMVLNSTKHLIISKNKNAPDNGFKNNLVLSEEDVLSKPVRL